MHLLGIMSYCEVYNYLSVKTLQQLDGRINRAHAMIAQLVFMLQVVCFAKRALFRSCSLLTNEMFLRF